MARRERAVRLARARAECAGYVLAATALLIVGVFSPLMTIRRFFFFNETHSLVSLGRKLIAEDAVVVGAVVLIFSVMVPTLKNLALLTISIGGFRSRSRAAALGWVEAIGKWSMLDVFVAAITIVGLKATGVIDVFSHRGVYLFGASILLTMVVTEFLKHVVRQEAERDADDAMTAPVISPARERR